MLAVVLLRGGARDREQAHLLDREPLVLHAAEHLAHEAPPHAVGLDDQQGGFGRHVVRRSPRGRAGHGGRRSAQVVRPSARRASATVYRDPVTQMRSPSAAAARCVERLGHRGVDRDGLALGAERLGDRDGVARALARVARRRRRRRSARACGDAADVLARADREHEVQPIPEEELAQRSRERLGTGGVVGAVEHDRRMPCDDLETSGPPHAASASRSVASSSASPNNASHAAIAAAALRTACSPNNGRKSSSYESAQASHGERLASHGQQSLGDLPVAELERHRRADLIHRPPTPRALRHPVPGRHGLPPFTMPAFSPRHLGQGRAELGMIEPDRGDHGDVARDEVRGVPRAAHADLEHAEGDGLVGEPEVREGGQRLEVGHPLVSLVVDELEERLQVPELLGELRLGDVDPPHGEPLGHRLEVRRRVQARREAVGARDLGRHPRRRALAVRARDVDRRVRQLGIVQVGGDRQDARQVGHHASPCGPRARRALPRSPSGGSVLRLPRCRARVRGREHRLDRERRPPPDRSARMLPASRRSAVARLSRRSRSCVS